MSNGSGGDDPTIGNVTSLPSVDHGSANAPSHVGPYRIIDVLGEGGMGIVYLAEQEHPIRRKVALKVIKLGMDTQEVITRFESERQVLALLNHPGIAKVLDAGTHNGKPFFAMEYVAGVPITEYCKRNKLSIRDTLSILVQVCTALHHAHQKGIIHRDVKPSNILVADEEGKGVPKIIDFGIAKAMNQRVTEKTLFTQYGVMIGTPAYMSPEQAEVTNLDIGTATDVYSLGVVLYELLTGVLPFDPERLRGAGFDEIRRIIREEEPPRPSTRIKELRGDLEWIVLKAISKDPADRYPSASEFGTDITRFLADEPVTAVRPSHAYILRKFLKKNARFVAAVLAVFATLVIGLVVSTRLYFSASEAQAEAEWQTYVAHIGAADASLRSGEIEDAKRWLELSPPRFRGWEWSYLSYEADSSTTTIEKDFFGISGIFFSSDGKRIIAHSPQIVRVYDVDMRRSIAQYKPSLRVDEKAAEVILTVSDDGQRVLIGNIPTSGTRPIDVHDPAVPKVLSVRELTSGKMIAVFNGNSLLSETAVFSEDGKKVVSAAIRRGPAPISRFFPRVWDAISGDLLSTLTYEYDGEYPSQVVTEDWPHMIAFGKNGTRLVIGSVESPLRIWDTVSGRLVYTLRGHKGPALSVAFSKDGRLVASGSFDKTVRLWDAESGQLIRAYEGHENRVDAIVFSPDGKHIASASADKTIRLWDTSSQHSVVLRGHDAAVGALAFSPEGRLLASAGTDGTIRLWRVDANAPFDTADARWPVRHVAFAEDGSIAAITGDHITLWDPGLKNARSLPVFDKQDTHAFALSPDGTRLASAASMSRPDTEIVVWDIGSGFQERMALNQDGSKPHLIGFTADGRRIISTINNRVRFWDAETGAHINTIPIDGLASSVALSSDGKYVAAGGISLRVWDATSGKLLMSKSDNASLLTFSQDGRLASVSENRITLWDIASGSVLGTIDPGAIAIQTMAWSPDGNRLVASGSDGTVRLWDTKHFQSLLILRPNMIVSGLSFSPSGKDLAGVGWGTFRAGTFDNLFAFNAAKLLVWRSRN